MGVVYAIVNQKGGVGKTTTAINLSAYMALAGARVLLLDLDPQGNATSGVGVDRSALKQSVYDVLVNDVPLADVILPTPVTNLFIAPSSLDLAGADIELMPRISRETFLRNALLPQKAEYEFCVIDAPPSLGLLTLNALVAAEGIILPIQAEYYALEGISQLLKTVDLVKRQLNPKLSVEKVILTMYDPRIRLANEVADEVVRYFEGKVSPTRVPRNVRLSEAPSHGVPVALYDPRSRGAKAYKEIAEEVMANGQARTR